MKKNAIVEILIALFILLFAYTASAKLIHFDENVKAMHNQPLAKWLTEILIYAIPISELIVVVLLCIQKTRLLGLYFFTALMIVFTGYVALVLSNHYGRIPCSCGGLMKELKWKSHLFVNTGFTCLGILSILLVRSQATNKRRFQSSSPITQ